MRRACDNAAAAISEAPEIAGSIGAGISKLDSERGASMDGICSERTLDSIIDDVQSYLIGDGVVAAIGGISDKGNIDGTGGMIGVGRACGCTMRAIAKV